MCVWTTLLYGIMAVGITTSSCRWLHSTAATHLRKRLRIHTKGHSSIAVLAQADLPLLPHPQRRLEQQARTLQKDLRRSKPLRWYEEDRISQITQQLQIVQNQGLSSVMVQIPEVEVRQIACTVCGQIFVNAAGLHQHFHQKHPELEQAACMDFQRETHSLYGLPQCRFCHQRMNSWQTLTKHITQGWCIRVKLALGSGHSLAKLLQDITGEEAQNPPVRQQGDMEGFDSATIPVALQPIGANVPVRDLHLRGTARC